MLHKFNKPKNKGGFSIQGPIYSLKTERITSRRNLLELFLEFLRTIVCSHHLRNLEWCLPFIQIHFFWIKTSFNEVWGKFMPPLVVQSSIQNLGHCVQAINALAIVFTHHDHHQGTQISYAKAKDSHFLKFLHLLTFFSELVLLDGYFVVRITRACHVRISVTMKMMVYLTLPLMLTNADWGPMLVLATTMKTSLAKLKCLSLVPRPVCQQAVRQICKNDFQKYMSAMYSLK